ncbi:MAG: AAA family ATPase [bacterium]
MIRRIAIANQKGGCGKTTTAVSLAVCLKDRGYKVLVIDMDPQANATQCLCPDRDSFEFTVLEALIHTNRSPKDLAVMIDPNLWIVPSGVVVNAAEQILAGEPAREARLKQALDRLHGGMDFVIIDSPPNIGLLTFNALLAANEVIIPVDPSLFSLQGVARILDAIELLRNINSHDISYRLLATMHDSRTKVSREVLTILNSRYRQHCFKTVIRNNVSVRESTGFGVPLTFYRSSRGLMDYRSLTCEVLGEDPTQKFLYPIELTEFLMPRKIGGGVLFSYLDPNASEVSIQGDFNDWNSQGDALLDVDGRGLWQRVVAIRPGRYRYMFVVNGVETADPNNPNTENMEGKGLVSVIEI